LAEADFIMANEQMRKAQEEARKAKEVVDPPVEAPVSAPASAPASAPVAQSQTLTTTQWLSVASIIVSLVAIYYKREEIKGALTKIKAPTPKAPVVVTKKSGIRLMD